MNRYKAARETLISNGNAGLGSARALALLTDEVLSRLVAASSDRPPGRWALLALGGYGAGTLLPNSDVDLLVLSEAPAALLKPFVECLLYPLWDAGLVVGHQVRSPKEHRAAARRDITVLTATLTGRVLAGDTGLGQALIDDCSLPICLSKEIAIKARVSAAAGIRNIDITESTAAELIDLPAICIHPCPEQINLIRIDLHFIIVNVRFIDEANSRDVVLCKGLNQGGRYLSLKE